MSAYLIVAPYTDGEIDAVLGRLEELLLQIRGWEQDEPPEIPLPTPLAGGAVLDALNDLQGHLGGFDRRPPTATLAAPDGRFELVPLLVVELAEPSRLRLIRGLGQVVAAGDPAGRPEPGLSLVREVLDDFDITLGDLPRGDDPVKAEVLADARRLTALLELPVDADVHRLHQLLPRPQTVIRQVLSPADHAAYERVTGRILRAWHRNDALQRYLYRGA